MLHLSHLHGKIEQEKKAVAEIEKEVKSQLLGFDFFENILPAVYNFVGASILNAGCVVNNAIEVANFMGFGPLFLCGVDFGFKDWVMRYPGVMKQPFIKSKKGWWGELNWIPKHWVKEELRIIEHEEEDGIVKGTEASGREIIISNNGIPTTDEQAEYKMALLSVYKLDRPQLFDCSDGIITELPKISIEEVVEKNGRGFEKHYRTDKEIIASADAYFHLR